MNPETADFMNAQARALRADPRALERQFLQQLTGMAIPPVERNAAPCPERTQTIREGLDALNVPSARDALGVK